MTTTLWWLVATGIFGYLIFGGDSDDDSYLDDDYFEQKDDEIIDNDPYDFTHDLILDDEIDFNNW